MSGSVSPVSVSRAAVPTVAAIVATVLGVVNLLSALTPNAHWRGHLLLQVEPIGVMHVFHALAVPASAALLVGAFYLRRRRRVAWQVALALLCGLAVLDIVKGLDVEEAALSAAGAALLWWGRDAFYVRGDPVRLRSGGSGACLRLRWRRSSSVSPPLRSLRRTRAYRAGSTRRWSSSPGSRAGCGSATRGRTCRSPWACSGSWRSVPSRGSSSGPWPLRGRCPTRRCGMRSSELVRRHGHDTLAFFKLRGDQHYLFTDDGTAFLGYRVESGVMLCAGDPVGPPTRCPGSSRGRAFAELRGLRLGAVAVSARAAPAFEALGLRLLYLGDEAIVDTALLARGPRDPQGAPVGHPAREGRLHVFDARRSPTLDERRWPSSSMSPRLARGRGRARLHDGARALGGAHQHDTSSSIARDGERRVRGFLHFVPSYGRPAVSLSFMRRDPETPNGLTEYLVARSIEPFRERGIEEVSLNFAAFARL